MDWKGRISAEPRIWHGQACITATRIMISVILDNLTAGEAPEAVAASYHIDKENLPAALKGAVERASEHVAAVGSGGS